jgi:CheY-like chemotaxis protein
MTAAVRILVASSVVEDAAMVAELLREEFDDLMVSTDPAQAVQDFEKYRPTVLILAFDALEKAERYYLGLYRLSNLVQALPHQTLILCSQENLARVYALCKKEYFDDYILFWPMAYDAPRLRMAVHHAVRRMAVVGGGVPTPAEIAAQARHFAELEGAIEQYAVRGGERVEFAARSLREAGQDIGAALDRFSHKLSEGDLRGLIDVKDRAGFQREFDRVKTEEIQRRFEAVAASVQPLHQWVGALKQDLEPQFESARALQAMAERKHPVVLIVDDDEFQHTLLRQLLAAAELELAFATSAIAALAALRRSRPDLILMDVNLPDIDGVEATRRIKSVEQFANIPVIMISGDSEKDKVVDCLKAGASAFVVKPLDKTTLLAKLRKFLH